MYTHIYLRGGLRGGRRLAAAPQLRAQSPFINKHNNNNNNK